MPFDMLNGVGRSPQVNGVITAVETNSLFLTTTIPVTVENNFTTASMQKIIGIRAEPRPAASGASGTMQGAFYNVKLDGKTFFTQTLPFDSSGTADWSALGTTVNFEDVLNPTATHTLTVVLDGAAAPTGTYRVNVKIIVYLQAI